MSFRSARRARYYESSWPDYIPVAERRRRAVREMEKLRKNGQPVSPVTIEGKKIAATFWGKAWCENLEGYADFASRIGRGRSYVRNGSVVDLQIAPNAVTAIVSGSSLYQIKIDISAVPKRQWSTICRDCAGGIDSLVELLQGRFSTSVMKRICRQADGLFPRPAEIRFKCSCPDWADMCKHVAAVLYGVGARLDQRPELLFRMRAVDENELVRHIDTAMPLAKSGPDADKVLVEDDLSALFGLDMDGANAGGFRMGAAAPAMPAIRKSATTPVKKASANAGKSARDHGVASKHRTVMSPAKSDGRPGRPRAAASKPEASDTRGGGTVVKPKVARRAAVSKRNGAARRADSSVA
jgi:uncharacterized Zn finger protein